MTLIEATRIAKELNYNYIAIDENGKIYAYISKPLKNEHGGLWINSFNDPFSETKFIGLLNSVCNWEKSLITLEDITV